MYIIHTYPEISIFYLNKMMVLHISVRLYIIFRYIYIPTIYMQHEI